MIAWTTFSTSFGLMKSVMPKDLAISTLDGFRSTPMILSAPAMRAPWMTFRPMPPRPNTATVLPGVTFAV